MRTQPKADSQRDRFIETARALGADENEAAFKAKLAMIARQKQKDEAPPAALRATKAAPAKKEERGG